MLDDKRIAKRKPKPVSAAKYRRDLHRLAYSVERFIEWLDAEMVKPSTHDRGKRVRDARDRMAYIKDWAKHFTLGMPLDKPIKKPKD